LYGSENVGSQVRLQVTLSDGTTSNIIPDNLISMPDGSYQIADAKMSFTKDLDSGDLFGNFSSNQKLAFPAIADGSATVQILNSQAGRAFFGDAFNVGDTISVNQSIDFYINGPYGQALRHYP
jgi:hypothetical protein